MKSASDLTATSDPALGQDRIRELDIIRGLALFGVLWMNMFGYFEYIVSDASVVHLFGESLDRYIGLAGSWLVLGKAQALFSLLFGFGFAVLSDRAEARGANARSLYLRRVLILLAIGVAHLLLIFAGDILHAYALMGLVLMMTRRWPSKLLLGLGFVLAIVSGTASTLWLMATTPAGEVPAVFMALDAGMARRWDVMLGRDYAAFVRENLSMAGPELYYSPLGYSLLGMILGRFLLGTWIYRQGWLQDTARYAAGFRRALPWLLALGLGMAAVGPLVQLLDLAARGPARIGLELVTSASQLVLALAYGCGIVVLCRSDTWRRRLSGLGAVGQMALTNYLAHSLVYLFVLNGFGLGLLAYAGSTVLTLLAVVVFALQIVFSRWWLARFRFGPLEWLWRSATYGRWQPFRSTRTAGPTPAAS
jgi:uncharacterized protein